MSEQLTIGAQVDGTDGEVGELVRVVIDPDKQALTHLVVAPKHHKGLGHLVPVELVKAVDSHSIRLSCTVAHVRELDDAEDIQFLPSNTDLLGYGAVTILTRSVGLPINWPRGSHAPIFNDRVPLGDVEIQRGDPVRASDGRIGSVEGLVVDPADQHVTHVLLQEGHPWGHKQVAIPIGATARIGEEVHVELTMQQIEDLPPVEPGAA